MSSDQPRRRESGGSPGSPMGSTAAIIIAIVAVVAGFLILRQIGDDDDGGGSIDSSGTTLPSGDGTVTPTIDPALTTPSVAPTEAPTTSFVPVTEGATVVVANASTVNGAAGQLTTALSGKGYTMAEATNSTVKQDASTVLYDATDPEALSVATSIATLMGNVAVSEIPAPPPVEGGAVADGVSVVVMLGNDKANLTLDAMGTPGTTLPGTTVPGDTSTSTTVP
jgi:hypothetical protein